jgi:GH25 family lysozyme M1 (1,4-beta-N-acetylmuramidase)
MSCPEDEGPFTRMRNAVWKWLGLGIAGTGVTLAAAEASGATGRTIVPRRPVEPFPYGGVGTSAQFLEGIDVSSAQGPNVDWAKARVSAALSFAIAKTSHGAPGFGFADGTFLKNKKGMIDQLQFWGGYHYAVLRLSARAQAELMVKMLGDSDDENMLPPSVDLEWAENSGANASRTLDFLYEWNESIRTLRGRRGMIYTSAGWWHSIGNPVDPIQQAFSLWNAAWTASSTPPIPKGWDRFDLWQYSAETGPMAMVSIDGVPGKEPNRSVDRDRFRGSLEDMQAFVDASRV